MDELENLRRLLNTPHRPKKRAVAKPKKRAKKKSR